MNKIKEFFRDWSIFEKVWLIFVCSLMTVIWFINGDTPFMLVLSLTGSLNLVLGAKGKVAGLYFAIINSAMYAYQCLGIPLYGEVMYNVLYSIPVSATAIYLWKKNATSDGEVRFRTMTLKLVAGVAIATAVGVWGYSKYMGGSFAFMDSLTTVVSVIASMLYLLRYSEQWLMWVIVNALSIIMWIMVFVSGDTTALLIIVMKTVNLLNSLYGYMNWRKISQKTAE